jgi:transcriptional regulator with XRE-family HTH domain
MSEKPAAIARTEAEAARFEKMVSVAYMRLHGYSQSDAADAAGVSERTVRTWENERAEWPDAVQAARDRWLSGLAGQARSTLKAALKDAQNGKLALDVIERLDPALLPARMRHEIVGDLPPVHFTLTDEADG